ATLYANSLPPGDRQSSAIARSFLFDAMLRRRDAAGISASVGLLAAMLSGLSRLSSQERRLVAWVLIGGVGGAFAMRRFYVCPRYFVHLLPLLYVGGYAFANLPRWTLGLAGGGLLAVARPRAALPMVDLRGAASHCSDIRASGGRCAVDGEFRGMEFYAPGVARLANLRRSIPSDATVLVKTAVAGSRAASFAGFDAYTRLPGWSDDVVFLRRDPPVP